MASRNYPSRVVRRVVVPQATESCGTFVIDAISPPLRKEYEECYSPALSRREALSVGRLSTSHSHQTPHLNCARSHMDGAPLGFSVPSSTSPSVEETALFLRETFFASQSRVLGLSRGLDTLAQCIQTLSASLPSVLPPSVWTVRDEWQGQVHEESTWLVFRSHTEAAAALSSFPSGPGFRILRGNQRGFELFPALESDLEPYSKLQPLVVTDLRDMPRATTSTLNATLVSPPASLPLSPSPTCETYPNTPSSTTSVSTMESFLNSPISPFGSMIPLGSDSSRCHMQRHQDTSFVLKSAVAASQPYTLSTNPPNPKTSFRAGDWICALPTCAAHNFGRNMACIGCGNPRPYVPGPIAGIHAPSALPPPQTPHNQHPRAHHSHQLSPRFVAQPNPHMIPEGSQQRHPLSRGVSPSRSAFRGTSAPQSPLHSTPGSPLSQASPLHPNPSLNNSVQMPLRAPAPSYPLLTPSGHALSAGGRVRNISTDPMAPCIMYWPDNEPIPERGQIRPLGSAVIQYPPIINTGNKGAAEKQPGDWICQKCNYLNWRRRKVCQTCYPYAEGNGDSISQAVQAERIALLTNVLNQVEPPLSLQPLQQQLQGSQKRMSAPIRAQNTYSPQTFAQQPLQLLPQSPVGYRPSARSLSHGQFPQEARPIYQTPSFQPHPLSREVSPDSRIPAFAPAPEDDMSLLPSFLQDIVQSEHSSPATSSSSAELSFDEYDSGFELSDGEPVKVYGRSGQSSATSSGVNLASIWKMDGEESKTFGYVGQKPDCMVELAGRVASGLSLVA